MEWSPQILFLSVPLDFKPFEGGNLDFSCFISVACRSRLTHNKYSVKVGWKKKRMLFQTSENLKSSLTLLNLVKYLVMGCLP